MVDRKAGLIRRVPKPATVSFANCARRPGKLGNQPPRLFGQSSVEVQHEPIVVAPEFGDNEGTRWAIRPDATSRDRRSSVDIT